MLSGINTNFKYKGETFHIQTEDGGADSPVITTLLFKEGAIYASKRTDYGEVLQPDSSMEAVQELMKEQHKGMIRDLTSGIITGTSGGDKRRKKKAQKPDKKKISKPEEVKPVIKAEKLSPKPLRAKSTGKKSLDDLILDYISSKEEDEK